LFKIDIEGVYGKDDPQSEWPTVPQWKLSQTVNNNDLTSVPSIALTPLKEQKINALKICLKSIPDERKIAIQKLIDENPELIMKLQQFQVNSNQGNAGDSIQNITMEISDNRGLESNAITETNNIPTALVSSATITSSGVNSSRNLSNEPIVLTSSSSFVATDAKSSSPSKSVKNTRKRRNINPSVNALELTPIRKPKKKSLTSRKMRNIVGEIQDNSIYEECRMADKGCSKEHGVCGYCKKNFHLDVMFPSKSNDNPTKIACKSCQFTEN